MADKVNFVEWLEKELIKSGLSQSDLARAVKLPPLSILQIAKRIPVEQKKDETLYRIEHLYHTLKDESNKQRALSFLEFLAEQEDKDESNDDRRSKKS